MTADMAEGGFFRVERPPRPSLARHVDCVWAARTLTGVTPASFLRRA